MKDYALQILEIKTHEKVLKFTDTTLPLIAIIAIHNTKRGPGLGGCRIYNYASEADAITDVLRLSSGMTYKNALADLNLGGAKSVIIGDPQTIKTPENLKKFGKFVESLQGEYITAPDVNTAVSDMEIISETTKHVVCLPEKSGGSGDSAYMTAYGVYIGMKAAANCAFGSDSLKNKAIGVEGVGKAGTFLIEFLSKENPKIYATDINNDALLEISKKSRVHIVPPEDFYDLDIDIYSPCAMGGTLNKKNIDRLKCRVIAGAANNQLEDDHKDGELLQTKKFIYAPDYLINAGGVINAYEEFLGSYSRQKAQKSVEKIYDRCKNILTQSKQQNLPSNIVADYFANSALITKK